MRLEHRLATSAALCMVFLLTGRTAASQPTSALRSFYVQLQVDSGVDIVNVEPVGPGVRIRVIRVALVHDMCPAQLVQAAERVLPRATVAAVAGIPLCSVSSEHVAKALARAPDRHFASVDYVGDAESVVATCGSKERVFLFRQPPVVDREKLRRTAPDVAAVWSLGNRVRAQALSEAGDPFYDESEEARIAHEKLGTSLVPELVSGKYEAAFRDWCWNEKDKKRTSCSPNYLAWQLEGYLGPPARRDPLVVEVVDRESLKLADYVAPKMPPIAESARVFGDVRLRVSADPRTGAVTEVETLSGSPLLAPAAVAAAHAWRFSPGSLPGTPIEVTVKFELRCPPG